MNVPPEVQGLWPDDKHGPFYIRIRFAEINGLMEPVWLEVRSIPAPEGEPPGSMLGARRMEPAEGGGRIPGGPKYPLAPTPITKEMLRKLPLAQIVENDKKGKAALARYMADTIPERKAELRAKAKQWRDSAKPQRGGMPSLGPGHYREVAEVYMKAAARGAPTKAVAKRFSVSKGAAAKWVGRARKLGFLPPTQRGKVSI